MPLITIDEKRITWLWLILSMISLNCSSSSVSAIRKTTYEWQIRVVWGYLVTPNDWVCFTARRVYAVQSGQRIIHDSEVVCLTVHLLSVRLSVSHKPAKCNLEVTEGQHTVTAIGPVYCFDHRKHDIRHVQTRPVACRSREATIQS